MKVIEHLENAKNPQVSVEIIPPRRGKNVQKIYEAVESIIPFNPPFIDVTSHSAEVVWEEQKDGSYKRKVTRKSPGTFGICAAIKYKFNVDPVPHILCNGFTCEETEDALIELNYLGIENLLLIRGDEKYRKPIEEGRTINNYALDLVKQVQCMNSGEFLDEINNAEGTDFCIGVSAYPEKHFEAPSMNFCLNQLKQKQDAGADYAVTQLFYDNQKFFEFKKLAREAGITIPIIPGMKVLTRRSHLYKLPGIFFTDFPDELVDMIESAKDDKEVRQIGLEWAYNQSLELLENGEHHLHFYIMQNTTPYVNLMEKLSRHL